MNPQLHKLSPSKSKLDTFFMVEDSSLNDINFALGSSSLCQLSWNTISSIFYHFSKVTFERKLKRI